MVAPLSEEHSLGKRPIEEAIWNIFLLVRSWESKKQVSVRETG